MLDNVTNIELQENGLVLTMAGEPIYLNYYWLRDNCASSFDEELNERTFDITALADPPTAGSAFLEGNMLNIEWANENHTTHYSLDWLRQIHANRGRQDPAALKRKLWRANHTDNFKRFSQHGVLNDLSTRAAWARALIEDGIAIITEMENSDQSLTSLCNTLGLVRPSVAGEYFDVKVHIEPVSLSFTAKALEMHTDTPAEEFPPGIQFLHCRENTVDGGYSLFLDGAAVAEDFKETHPEAFKLLSKHTIPFYYDHDEFDWRAHQRVIELDQYGAVSGVTVSQHMADVFNLPQKLLDDYYPAFCAFIKQVNDPKYLNRFRMNAGECYVFDNHRIVHGREAYTATSGDRYLRGCYIDRGELRSSYRTLVSKGHG
ncbi:MAG: TauD/TfdA family dioxygenase [Pseudomonadota bacterium]